jgi:hypothetical protein
MFSDPFVKNAPAKTSAPDISFMNNSNIFNDVFNNQTIDDIFPLTSSKKNKPHDTVPKESVTNNIIPARESVGGFNNFNNMNNITINPFVPKKVNNIIDNVEKRFSFNITNPINSSFSTESDKKVNKRNTLNLKEAMDILYNNDDSDGSFELEMNNKRDTLNNTPSAIKNKKLMDILSASGNITDSNDNITESQIVVPPFTEPFDTSRITMDINPFTKKPVIEDKRDLDITNSNMKMSQVLELMHKPEQINQSLPEHVDNRITINIGFGGQNEQSFSQPVDYGTRLSVDNNFTSNFNVKPIQTTRIPLNTISGDNNNRLNSAKKHIPMSPKVKFSSSSDVDTRIDMSLAYISDENLLMLKQNEQAERELAEWEQKIKDNENIIEASRRKQKELEKKTEILTRSHFQKQEMILLHNCFLDFLKFTIDGNEYDKVIVNILHRVKVIFTFKCREELELLYTKSDHLVSPKVDFEFIQSTPNTKLKDSYREALSSAYSDIIKEIFNNSILTVNVFYANLRKVYKYTCGFFYLFNIVKKIETASVRNTIEYLPESKSVLLVLYIPNTNDLLVKLSFEVNIFNTFHGIQFKGYDLINSLNGNSDRFENAKETAITYLNSVSGIFKDPSKIRNPFFFKNFIQKLYDSLNNINV